MGADRILQAAAAADQECERNVPMNGFGVDPSAFYAARFPEFYGALGAGQEHHSFNAASASSASVVAP